MAITAETRACDCECMCVTRPFFSFNMVSAGFFFCVEAREEDTTMGDTNNERDGDEEEGELEGRTIVG